MGWSTSRRVSVVDLVEAKTRGERWAMLTSYDALTAPIFEEAGARVLLVGDSSAMVVYGHDSTLPVSLDQLIAMAAAVVRSTHLAMVVGDLPFGSYQESPAQGVNSAVRMMKEAGVGAVKLEGGSQMAAQVEAIVHAGIPVMGHVGLTPQSVHMLGGNKVQGRGEAGERLLADAKALQHAGAFALVVEAVPAELGKRVTEELSIPVVGIGAGADTDAQVMVWQDMAGLTSGQLPKFVKQYAQLRSVLGEAAESYVTDVVNGAYPDDSHTYS